MASSDRQVVSGALTFLVAALLMTGCGHHGGAPKASQQGLFNDQQAGSCMAHQPGRPGPLYTAGAGADTAHILQMMQYYTANGTKPYCDRAAPNAADQAWGQLYVSLGGLRARVRTVLAHL